ncbi:hypothetical protein RRG08_012796 [Elysia crispata]|uniref:Uncharacterized protein n=1 Tax=Elysia crispata TaxID=231223 RepID=A0AAE0ZSZ4_9GAST|nr:hypothetical protein RRG08_012796 [Elysia crispata]
MTVFLRSQSPCRQNDSLPPIPISLPTESPFYLPNLPADRMTVFLRSQSPCRQNDSLPPIPISLPTE